MSTVLPVVSHDGMQLGSSRIAYFGVIVPVFHAGW